MPGPDLAPLVLLPSPLLGRTAWEPVRDALEAAGRTAVVAPLPPDPFRPEQVLAGFAEAVPAGAAAVLVPHSNAGLYAPALAEMAGAAATVYVDAALAAEEPTAPLAPPALLDHLAALADADGLLPPWTAWWEERDLAILFPDAATWARVEAAQPRVGLDYLRARVPVPDGWAARPSAYLAFGDTYAAETARALASGWPTEVLPGGHLHQLHDPGTVAGRVLALLDRLTPSTG